MLRAQKKKESFKKSPWRTTKRVRSPEMLFGQLNLLEREEKQSPVERKKRKTTGKTPIKNRNSRGKKAQSNQS